MIVPRNLTTLSRTRWHAALQRDTVVCGYLALERPTVADVDRCAAELGLRRRAFYYLIDRARAGRPLVTNQRARRSLLQEQERLLEEVTSAATYVDGFDLLFADFATRCSLAGIPAPSRNAVYRRLRQWRRSLSCAENTEPTYAVDHAGLELAIRCAETIRPAYLSVVVDLRTGRIASHWLDIVPPTARSAETVLFPEHLSAHKAFIKGAARVLLHRQVTRDWDYLLDRLKNSHVNSIVLSDRLSCGWALLQRLDALEGVMLRPRLSYERLSARIAGIPSFDIDEARTMVVRAVERINGSLPRLINPP